MTTIERWITTPDTGCGFIFEKQINEAVGKTEWDTRSVTSGVHTYKLMNGNILSVGKVVITK